MENQIIKNIFVTTLLCFVTSFSEARGLNQNAQGWTQFYPSTDSRIVYVSQSSGNDNFDGLSPATARKTINAGKALIRDGYPDWLLLKKGDTWQESFGDWRKSGRSASEPLLISSYPSAPGPRPRLLTGSQSGIYIVSSSVASLDYFALVGLDFEAHTRNPYTSSYVNSAGSVGFVLYRPAHEILIEDCRFQFYTQNISAHASQIVHFRLRRSTIAFAWAANTLGQGHSEGAYFDNVSGLELEENLWFHNGGLYNYPGDPYKIVPPGLSLTDITVDWFNHQLYIDSFNTQVKMTGNLFAYGDGAQARTGGDLRNNYFLRTINGLQVGGGDDPTIGGVSGMAVKNVFEYGSDFPPESATPGPRANAILVSNINASGLIIENNLMLHDQSAKPYGSAISMSTGPCGNNNSYYCPAENILVRGNTSYHWRGGLFYSDHAGTGSFSEIVVQGNVLQNPLDTQSSLVNHQYASLNGFFYADNIYDRGGSASNWFVWKDSNNQVQSGGLATWIGESHEVGAQALQINFPDPLRSIESYNQTLGGAPSDAEFLNQALQQSKDNWDPHYLAAAINAYLRPAYLMRP